MDLWYAVTWPAIVEREATRLRYFRIEDRIRITPPAEEPGRRLA